MWDHWSLGLCYFDTVLVPIDPTQQQMTRYMCMLTPGEPIVGVKRISVFTEMLDVIAINVLNIGCMICPLNMYAFYLLSVYMHLI